MKLKFRVTGMTCAACSARVEKVTSQVPGVRKAEVNLLAGTMQVYGCQPYSSYFMFRHLVIEHDTLGFCGQNRA